MAEDVMKIVKEKLKLKLHSGSLDELSYEVIETKSGCFSIIGNNMVLELCINEIDITLFFHHQSTCWDSLILVDLPIDIQSNAQGTNVTYKGINQNLKEKYDNLEEFYFKAVEGPIIEWFKKSVSMKVTYCGEVNKTTWISIS